VRKSLLAVIQRTAHRQFGLISWDQLLALGATPRQVDWLLDSATLLKVHRGVYRTSGSVPSFEQEAMAAVLAAGAGAVTAGRSAAWLWKLVEVAPRGPIEVAVELPRDCRRPGIRVRRVRELPKHDVTTLGGIPITRVSRTIIDLPRTLQEEAFDTAVRIGRVTPHVFAERKGYLGDLARDRLGLGVAHEKIERKAIAILNRHRIRGAVRQHHVAHGGKNYYIDIAFPESLVAVELKGWSPRWGRDRWQYENERSRALKLLGWAEFPFTWWDVSDNPDEVAKTIRQALVLSVRGSTVRG
jgi:very-short-patch-repair endonuclease